MNAQLLIENARAAGLSFEIVGADLFVETTRDPPPELLAELRQHKAELIAFLTPQHGGTPSPLAPAVDASDLEERLGMVEVGAGVPRRWAEGYAALSSMPAPNGFSPERWQRIVDAAGVFLDRWAAEAIRCGWSDLDVFGCNPVRPDARFDAMGLVLLLDRREVAGIDEHGADLVTQTGTTQRYRRRVVPDATVSLWELAKRERTDG